MKGRKLLTPDESAIAAQTRLAPGQERIYVEFSEQDRIQIRTIVKAVTDEQSTSERRRQRGNGVTVTKSGSHRRAKPDAPRRDWRHVHHSPWFWVGVAMFLAAILTYVFSEDLSLRPRLHRSAQSVEDRTMVGFSSP